MDEIKYESILIKFVNGDQEIFETCSDLTLGQKLVEFRSCEKSFRDNSGKFEHVNVSIYKDQILFIKIIEH